jgi:hypothetical protein
MAIADGDTVSMTVLPNGTSGLLGPLVQSQPPQFGVVGAQAGVDVLWGDSGLYQTGITATSLDVIGAPDAGQVTRLQGFFVRTANSSPEYQGIVVALYTRDNAGGGSPTVTLALVRTSVGTYRELLATDLVVVVGR